MKQTRAPLPDFIKNKPTLQAGLDLYYVAFWDLMGDRVTGGTSLGMIKWSAIDQYAARLGLDDLDEFHRFKTVLHRLDMAYMQSERDKEKK